MTSEQQRDLIRFLLKHLRGMTREVFAYQAVFMNLTPAAAARHRQLLEHYRHETPILQRVEKEYLPFDELLEQSLQDSPDVDFDEILRNYKPSGLSN